MLCRDAEAFDLGRQRPPECRPGLAALLVGLETCADLLKSSAHRCTSIAPSDAPADTPNVNGVASGFRSKA